MKFQSVNSSRISTQLIKFSGTCNNFNEKFSGVYSQQSFKRIVLGEQGSFWQFYWIFYSQSGFATGNLRGSFTTFSPKLKIFWFAIAFLDFSMQIYFQQSSLWVGLTGGQASCDTKSERSQSSSAPTLSIM